MSLAAEAHIGAFEVQPHLVTLRGTSVCAPFKIRLTAAARGTGLNKLHVRHDVASIRRGHAVWLSAA
jgi:hypothetical protein